MKDANGNPMFRKGFSKPKRQEEHLHRHPANVKREKDEAGWAAVARLRERLIAEGLLKLPKGEGGDKEGDKEKEGADEAPLNIGRAVSLRLTVSGTTPRTRAGS
jgi:hypothetical protein